MKKLVIKTTLITLGALIVLCLLVCGALFFFFPKSVANFFYNAGNYELAIKYYEKQLDKSNSIEDLYNLCVKLDNSKDSIKVEKYTVMLLESENFESFCASKNTQSSAITTEEFIEGKFIVSFLLNKNDIDLTLTKAQELVQNGYTEFNPFYMLYTDALIELNATQLYKIKDKIATIAFLGQMDAEERQIASADIGTIDQLLGVN